jgi:hypothetical protein
MEAIEAAGIRHQAWTLRFEHVPDRLIASLGMRMRFGVSDALIEQPAVQLLVAPHPDPRGEEALARHTNLVLNLPLLPA